MKTFYNKRLLRSTLMVLCMVTVLCVMLPLTSLPSFARQEVSGTVYASQIDDKAMVLTGDTNLVMDEDLILTSISGKYNLTVTGTGKLTVWAKWIESDAISVASLNVQTDLQVEAGSKEHCGIYTTGGFHFKGNVLDVTSYNTGIRATGGDILIVAKELNVAVNTGAGLLANNGSINVSATKLDIETLGEGSHDTPHGVMASENVTLKSNEGLIVGKEYGVYAQNGAIEMNGKFSIGADEYGVYAPKGDITLDGTFYVNAGVNAIRHEGPKDIRLTGDHTLRSSKSSTIYTQGYLYVDGKLDVRCDNSDIYALSILSSINIKGSVCKIDASGGGIYSQYGDIRINSAEIKVTGAVMAGIVAHRQGSVYLDGDQITVLCGSPTKDDVMLHHGIYAKDSVTVSVTELAWVDGREGIVAEEGNIWLYGGGEHQVQGLGNALRGKEIRSTGTLKVQTTNKSGEPYAIKSTMFAFDGDVLEVISTGGGIQATNGVLTITGTEITIFAKGTEAESDGIRAEQGDLSLTCTNATITGETGIFGVNNVVLNGNIYVEGTTSDGIYCGKNLTMTGKVTAKCLDSSKWKSSGILCRGNVKFTGSLLDVQGFDGIQAEGGSIEIQGSVQAIADYDIGITANGSITIIGADFVWIETKGKDNPLNDLETFAGVSAGGDILIEAKSGTILGVRYGILSDKGRITLNGAFTVVCDESCAIQAYNGIVTVKGDLSAASICEYHIICCKGFTFNGGKLFVRGDGNGSGIASNGDINITADSVEIYVKDGDGLAGQAITIDSDYLWVQTDNTDNVGYPSAIYAHNNVIIRSSDATIVGTRAIYSTADNIELEGTFAIGAAYDGVSAPKGYVKLNGSFLIQAGDIGVNAGESVVFNGANLNITAASNCIYVSAGDLSLAGTVTASTTATDKIAIYAFGDINLKGNVTVTAGGYEGIKADGKLILQSGYYKVTGCKTNYRAIYGVLGLTMDSALKVVVPDGGYNNGNWINTTKGTRATEMEIYAAIFTGDVNITIPSPVAGKTPPNKSYQIQGLGDQMSLDSIVWYEDGVKMTEGQAFKAGKTYTADLVLISQNGQLFTMSDMATVNGKTVSTGTGGNKLYLSGISLGKCPNTIGKVDLSLKAPVEGSTPSTTVTGNTGYGKDSIQWQVSTNGRTYTNMSTSAKFESGKYYRAVINVRTSADNYKFAVNGTQPDVEAVVNGYYASVSATAGKDAARYITVTYDFGICNDVYIEEIVIVDVVPPVAGEKPTYTFGIQGSGYHIDFNKDAYEEIYWVKPLEKWYYIIDGVRWVDVTDGGWTDVYEHDTFLPGHDYRVTVYVRVDDGFEFAHGKYYSDTLVTATLNGHSAVVREGHSDYAFQQEISYTFTCQQKSVDRIEINDIDYPASGKAPDYTAIEGNPGEYLLDTTHGTYNTGIFWYNSEGLLMEKGEVFRAGETYLIELRIVAPKSGGADLCKFASDVDVLINGTSVNTYGWWDAVEVNTVSNTVHVYYTFRQPAQAPEVGNTVMSAVSANDSTTQPVVKLYSKYDTTFKTPLYTAVVGDAMPGVDGNYNWLFIFADIPSGEYNLVVTKAGHQTHTSLVTISGGSSFPEIVILTPIACSHKGGSATCTSPAICTQCGAAYGEINPNHSGTVIWNNTATQHRKQYSCCSATDGEAEDHTWKSGACQICGYKCTHTGGTATCTKKATCSICGSEYGAVNSKNHTGTVEWKTTQTTHTATYTCCGKASVPSTAHYFENGKCYECGYVCTHTAELVKGKAASCFSDGSKDCYRCKNCDSYFADQNCATAIQYSSWIKGAGKIHAEHQYGSLIPEQTAIHTPTQLQAGMKAHYHCTKCDEYFDTEKMPVMKNSLIVSTPAHEFGDFVTSDPDRHWKACACGLKSDEGAHQFDNDADMVCNTCNYDRSVPHVHGNSVKQEGKAPTCTENGWKEYYQCDCGGYFVDAACKTEISSLIDWKEGAGKLAAGHDYGTLVPKVDATCATDGVEAHYECALCHTLFDANKTVKTANELKIPSDPNAHVFGDWTSNGDGKHSRVCANNASHVETGDCSGGTATCQKKAVCASCSGEYGDLGEHDHSGAWKTDKDGHWKECACGERAQSGEHADSDKDGKCDTCAYVLNAGGSDEPGTPNKPDDSDDPDQPDDPYSEAPEDDVPMGLIIGIVIGCIALGCGTIAALIVLKKRRA